MRNRRRRLFTGTACAVVPVAVSAVCFAMIGAGTGVGKISNVTLLSTYRRSFRLFFRFDFRLLRRALLREAATAWSSGYPEWRISEIFSEIVSRLEPFFSGITVSPE
jgi:hypothetical protein